jgi:hypothetical protein
MLKEEHRLMVFENGVLKIIFGLKRVEIGGWRNMHDEEHYNLYLSSNMTRMIESIRMSW